ncbi:MAG: bifunctional 2-polyprenyl-6-hydroxyphenol methylase/3-demethylubiquinol 3-O-methyltransferase UbiG [Gallionella sp.]|jgi:2-polyprenyl-6-hydroxyphenyl methylase/3-demethylubiquinone-9 3-methyltransferase|nr:bifunctional 2-polyprenyl-6-hydroxyphenol methylase/3-demethylubiquinol 3-O-methyltransferase UbiG [Gallionella sp.]MCK9355465.1 bifunctional 2-polyprenyl-6-hydroxyphenol methylase/3-demethylubiquinol 3-O-methyltransferase UbiG [Gallionella sp.]
MTTALHEASGSINVDPVELEKFSQLAHKWWDKNSEFKPLHDINPLRLNYIDRYAGLAGKTVLDVGCGGGILSEGMAAMDADVTGIDLADKSLKVAKLHLLESGRKVDYRKIAVEALAEEQPGHYDIVTCLEMLEHVPDPQSVIASCAKLAKPGGWVFFSTLNRNPKSYLYAILGAEYVLNLLPRGTHDYARFLKPSELAQSCRNTGLTVTDLTGMSYSPFSKTYSLGRDTDVNYMIACRKD